MRTQMDNKARYFAACFAALAWSMTAASAFASPLDNLLTGPAGSNPSAANSGAATSSSPTASPPPTPTTVPFTQRLDAAVTGAVGAFPGSCPGTNCDSSGDCIAIAFENLAINSSGGPSTNGSSGTGASSSSSSSASGGRAKATTKNSIRNNGIGSLQNIAICVNVDVSIQTPSGSGGTCMPASGTGTVNDQSFTASGELCTDANPGGSIYTLNASYGMENQVPPGAGSLIEAIDASSGTATILMRGTMGPSPIAVPAASGSSSGGPRRE